MKRIKSLWAYLGRWLVLLAWTAWGVALIFGRCLMADDSMTGALEEGHILKIGILSALASWAFIEGAVWIAPTRKLPVAVLLLLLLLSIAAYSIMLRFVAVVSISVLTKLAYPEAKHVIGPVVAGIGAGVGGGLSLWMAVQKL